MKANCSVLHQQFSYYPLNVKFFRSADGDPAYNNEEPATMKKPPSSEGNLGSPSEYFSDPCHKNKMTIVFHAVLAPHFEFQNGRDRIYMRFEGAIFEDFNADVVELHLER